MTHADGGTASTRAARGSGAPCRMRSGDDAVAPYLVDAARFPGGHCPAVAFPADEAQIAALLRQHSRILCSGARSSLTGGATPRGELVLSTDAMHQIVAWGVDSVTLQPGVVLRDLQHQAATRSLRFPAAPTHDGATIGGMVTTNAAGAATFKYGSTRPWVRGLSIVLADGDVLDLRRGRHFFGADDTFVLHRIDGTTTRLVRPAIRMPDVAKLSAGYFSAPGMDLIDLFIGSEGTLGVISAIELGLVATTGGGCLACVFPEDEARALTVVDELREAALRTRSSGDGGGLDVAAIEYLDERSMDIVRQDAVAARLGMPMPDTARTALLLQLEWAEAANGEAALDALARLLERHGLQDTTLLIPADDPRRRAAWFGLRESVPEGVNRRIAVAQRTVAPSISKAAADLIVPSARLAESLARFRRLAIEARLDVAIWGHVSDGNVHVNLLPRTADEARRAGAVLLAMGQTAIELGGAPMAEHGVGRNPVKQQLLHCLYGDAGIESMRSLKRALDPSDKLAPGVLWPASTPER